MATHTHTHSEHRRAVERELLAFGIQPKFERTNGGHMKIIYEAGGKTHATISSWTPSDWRTTLNTRAVIRRNLRAAGAFDTPVAPPPLLQKALSVPIAVDPLPQRIERLENDIATLLDMLADVAAKAGAPVEELVEEEPVEERQVEEPEPAPAEPEVKVGGKRAKMNALLECVGYTWTDVGIIASRDGRSRNCVSMALSYLKKKGLVESGLRGQWRKLRQQRVETEQALRAVAEQPVERAAERTFDTVSRTAKGGKAHALLLCVGYEWTHVQEITRRDGRNRLCVSVALNELKKKKLVENGERGMWRKVRQKVNGRAH